jgi:hypothetical protein
MNLFISSEQFSFSWKQSGGKKNPQSFSDNTCHLRTRGYPLGYYTTIANEAGPRWLKGLGVRQVKMGRVERHGTRRPRMLSISGGCSIYWSASSQPELAMKLTRNLAELQQGHVTVEPPLEVAPLEWNLAELGPLEIRQVRRPPEEVLFGWLLQPYHYSG